MSKFQLIDKDNSALILSTINRKWPSAWLILIVSN